MTYGYYDSDKHCRWCGTHYTAQKPFGRDGFCSTAHKQAHYRAYKKYVTATEPAQLPVRSSSRRKR